MCFSLILKSEIINGLAILSSDVPELQSSWARFQREVNGDEVWSQDGTGIAHATNAPSENQIRSRFQVPSRGGLYPKEEADFDDQGKGLGCCLGLRTAKP